MQCLQVNISDRHIYATNGFYSASSSLGHVGNRDTKVFIYSCNIPHFTMRRTQAKKHHSNCRKGLIPANQTDTAAWTPRQHSLNWKSDTYTVSRAQIAGCVISDPNLYPVGGKEFSQEPLGSMQALIDFGVEQREAGHPLFILMGGWRKQKELDKDAEMCVETFRVCDGKLYLRCACTPCASLHRILCLLRCRRCR